MKPTRKPVSSSRQKAPRVRNIQDLKGPVRPGTLIHFNAQQWRRLTKGMARGKAVPKYGVCLEGYPIPDGGVLAQPLCIEDPCEICRIRTRGITADGEMIFDCQCRPDPVVVRHRRRHNRQTARLWLQGWEDA